MVYYQNFTCGLPQGSVLGPLLFLTYINDMHSSLTNLHCQHYADDTVLYIDHLPATPISNDMNNDLANIAAWCNANKLSLNT